MISVYPNPVTDLLTIILPESQKNITLTLTDATGKVILHSKVSGSQSLQLDLKAYSKGVYFLKLETDRGSVLKKFVKN